MPQQALVDAGFRTVAVLAKAVAELHFMISHPLKAIGEVTFRGFLKPVCTIRKRQFEKVDFYISASAADDFGVLVERAD